MFFDRSRFERAKRTAREIDAGRPGTIVLDVPKVAELVAKRHTVYKRTGDIEKPVSFGLTAEQATTFTAAARRRLVRATHAEEGGSLFELTTFRVEEENDARERNGKV